MKISKELKAGLIALLAIVSFVIFFQFVKGKNIFSSDNHFFVKYDNVDGLEASNAVVINGLKVGLIEEIKPVTSKDGRISFVAKIAVDKQYEFSKNSTVEIFEPGLMAAKQLKINLKYDNQMAKSGDTLRGNIELSALSSITKQVGPVKDQLSSVLAKLDSTLAGTTKLMDAQNRQEIKILLANLNQTVASFKGTAEQTNRLLSTNERMVGNVLDNANKTMLSANQTVGKFGNVAENIDTKKLNNAVDKLSETADKLNLVISGISRGEGSLGKLAKDEELYNNLTKTSQSLDLLIKDLKENPKRYINISVFGKNK